MEWVKGQIEGVIIRNLVKHVDERGFLLETFRIDEVPENLHPVMSYVSYTEPGITRGPHEHKQQTDVFSFIGPGNFMIKLWDNRHDSKTYGNYMRFFAGEDKPLTVIVPPGVVHGYKNVSKTTRGMVLNYPDKLFMGWGRQEDVDEIRHEDEEDAEFHML